jgi:hypothetical protein
MWTLVPPELVPLVAAQPASLVPLEPAVQVAHHGATSSTSSPRGFAIRWRAMRHVLQVTSNRAPKHVGDLGRTSHRRMRSVPFRSTNLRNDPCGSTVK